jgi:tetratricopeptide (TPR) repeat protein
MSAVVKSSSDPRLAAGEQAAFHGPPAAGLRPLRAALARDPGQPRARWLLAVCLGALGRYADAAAVLDPVLGTDPLAATARASHLRQLARHAEAEDLDRAALRLAPAGPAAPEACADALVGLVADAVGRYDTAAARRRLATAGEYVATLPAAAGAGATGAGGGRHWRARIRLAWVSAEVALLCERPAEAAVSCTAAVRRSLAAGAPRHLVKSLLFRGVAEEVLGDPAAPGTLAAAAREAERLGLLPLVWPARLVRSRILASSDPQAAQGDLDAAHTAMRAIAVRLPADLTSALLTRTGGS